MCGLFGIVVRDSSVLPRGSASDVIAALVAASETRGREASGLAVLGAEGLSIFKRPLRGRVLLRSEEAREMLEQMEAAIEAGGEAACIGHTRMVTNGDPRREDNNQPVAGRSFAVVHNGIITNEAALWASNPSLRREAEVDTEVMVRLTERSIAAGLGVLAAVQSVAVEIEGGNSFAVLDSIEGDVVLTTANGSVHWVANTDSSVVCFASEDYILRSVVTGRTMRELLDVEGIQQLAPRTGLHIPSSIEAGAPRIVEVPHRKAIPGRRSPVETVSGAVALTTRELAKYTTVDTERIAQIRRCTRCILPETFPGLSFDEQGLCSVCRADNIHRLRPMDELRKIAGDEGRVLVPLSGGRDSCFGLHVAVREMGLDAVAYTYDWGMVTDLARRNISRMCGELGVEHILVSADIARKRENVRRNVLAWLRRPHLGAVPLFMSGDKQFYLHAQRLRSQLDRELVLLASNPYERTDFKAGFAGVDDAGEAKQRGWDLGSRDRLRILQFYAAQFLRNPAYLNRSVADTAFAFASYYLIPKRFESVFDFRRWDEREVDMTLLDQYGWEVAGDTDSTWRIGDGTAPFYNYIYLKVAGFTENDALRSNQVRAGHMGREEALRRTNAENQPRLPSLAWYFDRIGIDGVTALKTINRMPSLY